MLKSLSEDLMLALWEQSPALIISCYRGENGTLYGVDEKNQMALDTWKIVNDLPGYDGKGPLIITHSRGET